MTPLLAGAVAGLGVAMPVGAITTLIALLAAQRGWRVGAAAGLGAATVDGAYASVALLFGALVTPLLVAWRTPLRWVAAGVLLLVALHLLRPALQPTGQPAMPSERPAMPSGRATTEPNPAPAPRTEATPFATRPGRAYLTFVGLTVVNPTTVVYFAALATGGSVGGATASAVRAAAFVVGAFTASAAWQLVIAGAGHGAGQMLTGTRGRRWAAIVGSTIVVVLAARTALGR